MNVDELLSKEDPEIRRLAQGVRGVIRKSVPEADELVKWRNPVYRAGGKDVARIMLYGDHVNLGFFMGAKLKSKRLEGTGKGLRHVKVRRLADIDCAEFSRLLKEAVALVKSG